MGGQDGSHYIQIFNGKQAPLCKVGHEHHGQHDFVGRHTQDESGKDHTVQPEKAGKGIERSRQMGKRCSAADIHVGEDPDHESCRCRDHDGSGKDKDRPVKDGTDDHPAELRNPVRRQFQGKRRRHALQQSHRKQFRNQESHQDAQHDDNCQGQGRQQGCRSGPACRQEHGADGDDGREAPVAGHKIIGKDGDQPFPGRIDDAASCHAGRIAAKTHAHGQSLFAAGIAFLETSVQIESDAGQIPEILKERKKRKENRHGREHD